MSGDGYRGPAQYPARVSWWRRISLWLKARREARR